MVSQSTIEHYSLLSHTSSGRKNKGSKGCLLNFSNAITILPLLLSFVASIQGGDTGVAVARCVRMKNPYVKKGTPPLPPETPRMDVSPSFILTVSSLRLKKLPSKRLQRWFNGDIMTNPRKPLSSDVSQSIVADKREASMLAYHGMVSRK